MVPFRSISDKDNDPEIFLNLNSNLEISDMVNALLAIAKTESLPNSLLIDTENVLYNCIHSYTNAYRHLPTDKHRKEFRDAGKRHQRTLNSILSFVIQSVSSNKYEMELIMHNNTIEVKFGSMLVMKMEVIPNSFRSWYNALKLLSHDRKLSLRSSVIVCRMLASVYNIVNEPVLLKSEEDSMAKETIDLISGRPKYSSIADFKTNNTNNDPKILEGILEIKETIRIIKDSVVNNTRPPLWASDIVRAIRSVHRNQRLFVYDNNQPLLSVNSTCSSMVYKNKRVTIPGLFAACIEDDYFKENYPESNFDSITGFNLKYRVSNVIKQKISGVSQRRKSVVIKQRKPKPRIIHPLNNSEQDRLLWYHNILANVLQRIPSDCTFDQSKGQQHIRYVMEKEPSKSVYSLDLTNASDTFSMGLQWLILKELILINHEHGSELADLWLDMMTSESAIKFGHENIRFKFSNGQPQGFLSSFPSFALEHHICVLTVMRLKGFEDPKDFYRLLGDDLVITCDDDTCEVPDSYVRIANAANVECNLQKGYLFNPGNPEMSVKIAEFAKYLILDGLEITPIPTKLLVTNKKVSNYLALAAWYSQHRDARWSPENLSFFLETIDSFEFNHFRNIIDIMIQLNVPGILTSSFGKDFTKVMNGYSKEDVLIIQTLLTHRMIYAACNRIIGSKKLDNNLSTLIHLSKELRIFFDNIEDNSIISKDNKLFIVKEEVLSTYRTFEEVCRRYSSLKELSSDDIMLICMLLNTNNAEVVKTRISQLFVGLDLLTINPKTDVNDRNINDITDSMLKLFEDFNMTIDKSWSTLAKHFPDDFLEKLMVSTDEKLLQSFGTTLSTYVLNTRQIGSEPVVNESLNESTESIDFGDFEGYSAEDWQLIV